MVVNPFFQRAKRAIYASIPQLKVLFVLTVFTVSVLGASAQGVRINEVLSSNDAGITDLDGDTPDWIEIYNHGSENLNLEDWSLTDNSTDLTKWTFPDVVLAAGEYLIVFASGKDLSDTELHTNFSIDKNGEYLALVNASGAILSEFDPLKPLQSDYSLAYEDGVYVVTSKPTPGSPNTFSEGVILPAPSFSKQPGYYENTFQLELSSNVEEAEIYFTLDASDPSVNFDQKYTSAITITTTTIVRAVCKRGDDVSASATGTFIFPKDVVNQPAKPTGFPEMWGPYEAISGTAIGDYEMDPEITEDSRYQERMVDALKALPVVSVVTDRDNLFLDSQDPEKGGIYIYTGAPGKEIGKGWERPASIEYFSKEGERQFQVNCGLKIHGQHSRRPEKTPKHSLRVSFKTEYGPSKLKYDIFGEPATKTFNSLILKTSFGNSATHHQHSQRVRSQWARDNWAKDTQLAMGQVATRSLPVHLYIDGLYWGLYFICERPNEDFFESYLGGNTEDYDVIRDYTEVDAGTIDAWNEMMSLARGDMSNNVNYYRLLGKNTDGTDNPDYPVLLDPENLVDYMLINFYGGNSDWDHKNWVAAYNRTNPDGFKFLCWDSEMILNGTNDNVTGENNNDCPSELFQRLMTNNEFKIVFEKRSNLHCTNGGALTPTGAGGRFEGLVDRIDLAVLAEYARWGDYRRDVHQHSGGPYEFYTPEDFEAQREFLKSDYFPRRTDILLNQLESRGFAPEIIAPTVYVNGEIAGPDAYVFGEGDELTIQSPHEAYYSLVGVDPRGAEAGSYQAISVLGLGTSWKYLDGITSYPTGWTGLSFEDSGWSEGEAQLGYGDGDEKTQLTYGGNSSNKIPAYLFRKTFEVTDKSDIEKLQLGLVADDGAVVYLNGQEIYRFNMNEGAVSFGDHAAGTVQDENSVVTVVVSSDQLVEGTNVVACEVHQASGTSSDVSFDLSLDFLKSTGSEPNPVSLYQGSVTLAKSGLIRVRALDDGEWSGLVDLKLIRRQDRSGLILSEIQYNPTAEEGQDGELYEFLELVNESTDALDMGGISISDGIDFSFPLGYVLQPGEYFVVAANRSGFYSRYKWYADGFYTGKLSNSGESIVAVDFEDNELINVEYDDENPWPSLADGDGYSLVPDERTANRNPSEPASWRRSTNLNGSPGEADPELTLDLESFELSIYPNPVHQFLTISSSESISGIRVIDMAGGAIPVNVNQRLDETLIDVRTLNPGVYVLKARIADKKILRRFVVR